MSRAPRDRDASPPHAAASAAPLELSLSPEQQALRDALRAFLGSESGALEALRASSAGSEAFERALWRAFGERGWLRLDAAVRAQADEGGLLESAIAAFEVGRCADPIPFRTGAVESLGALARLATRDQREQWLPDLLAGSLRHSLALLEAPAPASPGGIQLRAERSGESYVLRGVECGVEFGETASGFAVAVRTQQTSDPAQGISLLLVAADAVGLTRTSAAEADPLGRVDLHFDSVQVPVTRRVGIEGAAWPALERVLLRAQVALCAEAAGGARRALELATAHALRRVQWDRPIGSFQAVQHQLADALVDADAAELACFDAASSADAGLPFAALARAASVVCSEAYRRNAARAQQLLGGAGHLADSELPTHARRAAAIAQRLGGVEAQRQALARELGL